MFYRPTNFRSCFWFPRSNHRSGQCPRKNPLAGAQVWLEGFPIGTTTNSSGEYFVEVPMHGVFKVVYQFIGFKSETLAVEVGHGTTVRRNISLQPVIIPRSTT
ncbi:MAG: carboxypeptidase-like regulatory domain-containing protein [bacterium]